MRKKGLMILLAALLMIGCTAAAAFAFSGAIWTTDSQGNAVNQNVWYPDKYSVYLNGGPNDGTSHLAPGTYYIQVTDPGGNRLGSVSPAYQIGDQGQFIATDLKSDVNPKGTQIQLQDGEVLVQLYAATKFNPTPNNGGVYKAWISTDPNFVNNVSKTDNFKVKVSQKPYLIVDKFEDINSNGIQDPGEGGIKWSVTITNTTLNQSWVQPLDGGHWEGFVDPGNYTITEQDLQPEWVPTTPPEVKLTLDTKGTYSAKFGNHHLAHLIVKKFDDTNGNGKPDPDEQFISWGGTLNDVSITMTYDQWVEPGTYTAVENQKQPEWVPTTVTSQTVTLAAGETKEIDFGNHHLAHLIIIKFEDLNKNGIQDPGESNLDWSGTLNGATISIPYGQWVEPGTYTAVEEQKLPEWVPTTATDVTIILAGGDTKKIEFGNHRLALLKVYKFNDRNGNGIWDPNEESIPWTGTINGKTMDMPYAKWVEPGTYTLIEDTKPGWVPTTLTTQEADVKIGIITEKCFGNRQLAKLEISKFYDFDGDGDKDADENLITWKVNLSGIDLFGKPVNKDIDLVDGHWVDYIDPGAYTVTEYDANDTGWSHTTATSVSVVLEAGGSDSVSFGNRYLGTGGHTHGYWGNNNGEANFILVEVNKLPLVDGNGKLVTPFADYNAFAVWNQEANGNNAANMLSCQLAAMVLNGAAEYIDVNGYVLIDANTEVIVGSENVNNNGVVKVADLIDAAIQSLSANPLTIASGPDREYQNALEKVIDNANQDNARVYIPSVPPTPIF